MNETKRRLSVIIVVLTSVLVLGVLALSTGIASAENSNISEQITPEELFELLSGNWSFNGTMTIGEQPMPTISTRTVSLTGPTAADFVVVMGGEEEAETGEAWWDADKEKFAIKEGDEAPRYYDLLPKGYGSTYEMDGLLELGIMENVTCEESETFVDDNTTVKTWTAKNITDIEVAKWEGTFTRIKEASVEEYERIGILVIGHGSPSDSWCAHLRSVVANVSSPYPVELGFLEFVPNETISIAVDKLDEAGVKKIIAVPLFISSHSGHIGEIEYVLGLREELPTMSMMSRQVFVEGKEMERSIVSLEGRYSVSYMPVAETVSAMGVTAKQHHGGGESEEEELVPVDTEAEIVLTNAIDDHWAIADILVDHAAMLIENPANETIVLVAHGTDNESDFAGWVNSSESLAEQMRLKLRYGMGLNISDVRYSFVFPNETLHSDLLVSAVVEHVSATSDPIVVPLLVSEGHFTGRKIPGLLENISYAYPEEGARALTPHPDVAEWIELTAAKALSYPSVQIYDGEELLTITIEDAGKYHGEGVVEICPCVASAFRSTLRAFSEDLWNGTPQRGDVKINSGHPSDGHVMTFEYILDPTEDLTIDEGADIVNITADNYVYTFTRKSTNDSVTIRVKEEIFPERFFELRTKCKLARMGKGDVTKEETKAFKMFKEELKEKLMYLPEDSVFEGSS